MKVSEYIAQFLSSKGVDTIFTIPGGGCIFLNDAFARQEGITPIVNHHEQACALAAEGYARLKGKLGACLVTSGPGGTNAITGTLCSYQDSVPVMVISGNVNKDLTTNYTGLKLRQLGDQEFNIVKVVESFTKYAIQVNDPLSIRYHLEKAYHLALDGRPGPVWLDIPLDVQPVDINPEELNGYFPEIIDNTIDTSIIDLITNKLNTAQKPLIIAGHGVRLSKSTNLLDSILETHQIPVITSFNGNDSVSNEYEYYCGRFGTHANISANKLVQEADFVLTLGSRLYVRQIGYNFTSFAKNAYKVYVDIEEEELNKPTLFPDLKVVSDVKSFLNQIQDKINLSNINPWREYCKQVVKDSPTTLPRHFNQSPLSIYEVVESLNPYMDSNLPVVTSDGSANIVGMQVLKLKKHQRLFSNKSTAPMGYGLPASIGACFANNLNPIICLEGDGSLHMNIHELQVVSQNQLPIKIFVFNNDGYLSIKITQKTFCNNLFSLSNSTSGLTLPDYEQIAKAYKLSYRKITSSEELKIELKECFSNNNPELIEIFVNPMELHEPKVMAQIDENGQFIPGELQNIQWLN
jgi:acetolactate synthase-1/2/3 large subunit